MDADSNAFEAKQRKQYRIIVQGYLHARWAEWFSPLTLRRQPDKTTILEGSLPDQAALYGTLIKLRDMGLVLLSVNSSNGEEDK